LSLLFIAFLSDGISTVINTKLFSVLFLIITFNQLPKTYLFVPLDFKVLLYLHVHIQHYHRHHSFSITGDLVDVSRMQQMSYKCVIIVYEMCLIGCM